MQPQEYNAEQNGIPYITGASNFLNGQIVFNRWTTFPQVISETGDLLITCKGTVGEMGINRLGEVHIARQIMAIRNLHGLNIEYLRLFLLFRMARIKNAAKGLIPGISREDILNLIIPIPPLHYQQIIVTECEKQITILTQIEENLN